jgi:o-succinylbenzoate synthase
MPGFTITGDISASSRFYKQDITDPIELVDGYILIPDVPGLAAQPRRQRLAEATVETVRIAF